MQTDQQATTLSAARIAEIERTLTELYEAKHQLDTASILQDYIREPARKRISALNAKLSDAVPALVQSHRALADENERLRVSLDIEIALHEGTQENVEMLSKEIDGLREVIREILEYHEAVQIGIEGVTCPYCIARGETIAEMLRDNHMSGCPLNNPIVQQITTPEASNE